MQEQERGFMEQDKVNNSCKHDFNSIIFDTENHDSIWGIRPERVKITQSLSLNDIVKHFHHGIKCSYCGTDKNVRVVALDSNPENFLISNLECMCKTCFEERFANTTVMQSSITLNFLTNDELTVTFEKPLDRITRSIINNVDDIKQVLNGTFSACNHIPTDIYLMFLWKELAQDSLLKGIIKIEMLHGNIKHILTSEAMQTFIMNNISDLFKQTQKSSIIL